VDEWGGLESRCGPRVTVGSNPTPSAINTLVTRRRERGACRRVGLLTGSDPSTTDACLRSRAGEFCCRAPCSTEPASRECLNDFGKQSKGNDYGKRGDQGDDKYPLPSGLSPCAPSKPSHGFNIAQPCKGTMDQTPIGDVGVVVFTSWSVVGHPPPLFQETVDPEEQAYDGDDASA
jgi:hypothetical protein